MHNRIVSGLIRQQQTAIKRVRSADYLQDNEACIENVRHTWYQHPDHVESLHAKPKEALNVHWASPEENASPRSSAQMILPQTDSFLGPTIPQLDDEDLMFVLEL